MKNNLKDNTHQPLFDINDQIGLSSKYFAKNFGERIILTLDVYEDYIPDDDDDFENGKLLSDDAGFEMFFVSECINDIATVKYKENKYQNDHTDLNAIHCLYWLILYRNNLLFDSQNKLNDKILNLIKIVAEGHDRDNFDFVALTENNLFLDEFENNSFRLYKFLQKYQNQISFIDVNILLINCYNMVNNMNI